MLQLSSLLASKRLLLWVVLWLDLATIGYVTSVPTFERLAN